MNNLMPLSMKVPGNTLTFREFIRVLAHFRPCTSTTEDTAINSRIEKLKFAFSMYDLNKNGFITRTEFKLILKMMIGPNITSTQLDSITNRTITEGDYEKNGKISFEEFARVSKIFSVFLVVNV
uniref:EF-hand domain-containing protein n=1 Tax=Elaeophora elaphi TaxID=1147741 RepID=A0A0R3S4P7_9BILA